MEQQYGLIAILDALGAASYTDEEISQFLESRGRVLELLKRNAHSKEIRGDILESGVTTFTLNDTVLIVYRVGSPPDLNDVKHFCLLLRKFIVDSLAKGILFRGVVSLGTFYVDDESNTVMGQAVTDAAAWYESAEWIGIHTTPHASLAVQRLLEQGQDSLDHVLVDYAVPLKGRPALTLKAINWPKIFLVASLAPPGYPKQPRAKCLALLTRHRFPKGAESKHFNAVAFFDYCVALVQAQKKTEARTG